MNAILLDVHDADEREDRSSSPYYGVDFAPMKGRLPGAFHILWYDLIDKDWRRWSDIYTSECQKK